MDIKEKLIQYIEHAKAKGYSYKIIEKNLLNHNFDKKIIKKHINYSKRKFVFNLITSKKFLLSGLIIIFLMLSLLFFFVIFNNLNLDGSNKGWDYIEKGEYDKAISFFNNMKVKENSYLGLSSAYFKKGEYNKALDYLNKSLENKSDNIMFLYERLGMVYYKLDDCNNSLYYFNKIKNLNFTAKRSYYWYGICNERLGKEYLDNNESKIGKSYYMNAINFYEKLLESEPIDKEFIYEKLGDLYFQLAVNDFSKNKKDLYEKIIYYLEMIVDLDNIKINNSNYFIYRRLSYCYVRQENFERAEIIIDELRKYNSNDPFIYGIIGLKYFLEEEFELAKKEFEKMKSKSTNEIGSKLANLGLENIKINLN